MTLFRQLMILIICLIIACFFSTLYITYQHSRDYYQHQLEITAQDTATSLGLSLSSHTKDKHTMLSMVNAIFDRGYFSKIEVSSMSGKTIIRKESHSDNLVVPGWFMRLVAFPSPEREALLLSGWRQLGRVTVVSDPGPAYHGLWLTCLKVVDWFSALTLTFLVIAFIATRILFRPLVRVAEQARAVCENEFQLQTKLPKTRELYIITDAMNRTVLKLKELFSDQATQIQGLRQRVYQDSLTGIANRRYFEQKLRHILNTEEAFRRGALIFVEINGLSDFNRVEGFQKGDELILSVVKAMHSYDTHNKVYFEARITGASFALIVFEYDKLKLQSFSENLLLVLQEQIYQFDKNLSANAGGALYGFKQTSRSLLSAVDNALEKSRALGLYKAAILAESNEDDSHLSAGTWHEQISYALKNNNFKLYVQKVMNSKGEVFHKEVYAKFMSPDGVLYAASQFFPMAEKVQLAADIDLHVVSALMELQKNKQVNYAINLSTSLLHTQANIDRLLLLFSQYPEVKSLNFELSEHVAIANIALTEQLITKLNELGHVVGLDRVGASLSPMHYLSQLKVRYIKLDGSFSHELDNFKEKQFFIRHMKIATRTLGVELIATNVETEEEWARLQELGISWGQGLFLDEIKHIS